MIIIILLAMMHYTHTYTHTTASTPSTVTTHYNTYNTTTTGHKHASIILNICKTINNQEDISTIILMPYLIPTL